MREESLGASDTFYMTHLSTPLVIDFHQVTQFLVSLGLLLYKMRAIIYTLTCIYFICYLKDLVYNNSQFMIA